MGVVSSRDCCNESSLIGRISGSLRIPLDKEVLALGRQCEFVKEY